MCVCVCVCVCVSVCDRARRGHRVSQFMLHSCMRDDAMEHMESIIRSRWDCAKRATDGEDIHG